jgi:hypothetical protein
MIEEGSLSESARAALRTRLLGHATMLLSPGGTNASQLRDDLMLAAAVLALAERDIHAYRGALGYSVPGGYGDRLSDGTIPVCGLCAARQQMDE